MTPAGTSDELDVQNEREENTHTHQVHPILLIINTGRRQDGKEKTSATGYTKGEKHIARDTHEPKYLFLLPSTR